MDLGDPYRYGFEVGEATVSQAGQLAIAFRSNWLGEGLPGAVTCRATATDAKGNVVASTLVNIAGEASGDSAIHLTAPVSENDSGFTGSIHDCQPFVSP
jgi:hypothetical protein